MLNSSQRWIVFAILCLITVGAVAFEAFLLYSLIDKEPSWAQTLMTIATTGLLYAVARIFIEISRRTFIQRSILPVGRSHRFASERCRIIEDAKRTGSDEYSIRRKLVSNTLKFAEECLQGWLPGSHFELCVFVDQDQPLLFGYFDSNHHTTARSMAEREQNPAFYIQKGYEVTKVLQKPTSHPRILQDTHDARMSYVFTTKEQRKQLRSTVLHCLDLVNPCALVISSNEKSAFPETDPEVISFVRLMGELVRYDLFEGDFVHRVRALKPQLFSGHPAHAIGSGAQSTVVGHIRAPAPLSVISDDH